MTRCERGTQGCTPACESILSSIRSPESRLSRTRRVSRVRRVHRGHHIHPRLRRPRVLQFPRPLPSVHSRFSSILSSNFLCSLTLSRRLTDRSRHRATSSSSSAVRCHRRRRWFVVRRSSFVVRRSSFVVVVQNPPKLRQLKLRKQERFTLHPNTGDIHSPHLHYPLIPTIRQLGLLTNFLKAEVQHVTLTEDVWPTTARRRGHRYLYIGLCSAAKRSEKGTTMAYSSIPI